MTKIFNFLLKFSIFLQKSWKILIFWKFLKNFQKFQEF